MIFTPAVFIVALVAATSVVARPTPIGLSELEARGAKDAKIIKIIGDVATEGKKAFDTLTNDNNPNRPATLPVPKPEPKPKQAPPPLPKIPAITPIKVPTPPSAILPHIPPGTFSKPSRGMGFKRDANENSNGDKELIDGLD